MRKFLILTWLAMSATVLLFANGGGYSVANIAPALIKNANAVLRLEEMRFEVSGTRDITLKNHYVVTILNEKGEHLAEFSEYYNTYREIISVDGFLYDKY